MKKVSRAAFTAAGFSIAGLCPAPAISDELGADAVGELTGVVGREDLVLVARDHECRRLDFAEAVERVVREVGVDLAAVALGGLGIGRAEEELHHGVDADRVEEGVADAGQQDGLEEGGGLEGRPQALPGAEEGAGVLVVLGPAADQGEGTDPIGSGEGELWPMAPPSECPTTWAAGRSSAASSPSTSAAMSRGP